MIRIFVPPKKYSFEHTFFLRYGLILPKVLFLPKPNYVNLNFVTFQPESTSQQEDIQNGISPPISNGIFSCQNTPNIKPLFLGVCYKLKLWDKKFGILIFLKPCTIQKFYETIPLINNKKGHQRWTLLVHSKKTLTLTHVKLDNKFFRRCQPKFRISNLETPFGTLRI